MCLLLVFAMTYCEDHERKMDLHNISLRNWSCWTGGSSTNTVPALPCGKKTASERMKNDVEMISQFINIGKGLASFWVAGKSFTLSKWCRSRPWPLCYAQSSFFPAGRIWNPRFLQKLLSKSAVSAARRPVCIPDRDEWIHVACGENCWMPGT